MGESTDGNAMCSDIGEKNRYFCAYSIWEFPGKFKKEL